MKGLAKMTIRYQCPECDSVLKIKDELAGTDGKCPKCKTKFVVPQPEAAGDSKESEKKKSPGKKVAAEKSVAKEAKAEAKKPAAASGGDDDDFDPAAFLMEDGPGAKSSAGLSAPKEEAPKGPAVDAKGRRLYTSGSSKARAASMSPAAAAANEQLDASANARDLLSKSMEESRVKASTMPQTEKKPMFDFSGAGKELLRYAPHAVGAVLGIFLLYWMMNKMLGESIELPELGPVSGTVTFDGDPVAGVAVQFTPLDDVRANAGDGPDRVRTSTGITDENGYYTLYYLDNVKGAVVGKGRLWIEVRSPKDIKRIPPEWTAPGPNIREVKKTGNNQDGEFNIVLKSK